LCCADHGAYYECGMLADVVEATEFECRHGGGDLRDKGDRSMRLGLFSGKKASLGKFLRVVMSQLSCAGW
jgi:hypothetical protein